MPEIHPFTFNVLTDPLRESRYRWTVCEGSQIQLSEKAGVHRNTISRAETEATAHGHAVAQMVRTLEAASVEFTNGDQPGVRMRKGP